jgi:hypothetical protein
LLLLVVVVADLCMLAKTLEVAAAVLVVFWLEQPLLLQVVHMPLLLARGVRSLEGPDLPLTEAMALRVQTLFLPQLVR